jgi:hypothetical protein
MHNSSPPSGVTREARGREGGGVAPSFMVGREPCRTERLAPIRYVCEQLKVYESMMLGNGLDSHVLLAAICDAAKDIARAGKLDDAIFAAFRVVEVEIQERISSRSIGDALLNEAIDGVPSRLELTRPASPPLYLDSEALERTMQADPVLEDHLRQLEERILQPSVRKSAEEVSELLASEFIEFGSSGRIFDRQQIIASLQMEPTVRRSVVDFRTCILAPAVVLVTYRAVRQGTSDAQPIHSLRSSIWKLIDGRWQMVFHQGTPSQER